MEKDKPKLKPCPFCGGTKLVVTSGPLYKVICENWMMCGIEGPRYMNRLEAIAAWNRRAR